MDIILMGTSKSGKSSIKKVVFEKMVPHETSFIEPTLNIESLIESIGYYSLKIIEIPSSFEYNKITLEEEKLFNNCRIIIYVLDCQNLNKNDDFQYFENNVFPIVNNKKISLKIFMHKFDKINDFKAEEENKKRIRKIIETNRNTLIISFDIYKTSIYNYSLFESFSYIFQSIFPQNSVVSDLLGNLIYASKLENIYLFDVMKKMCLAESDNILFNDSEKKRFFTICFELIDIILISKMMKKDSKFNGESSCLIKTYNIGKKEKSRIYYKFIDSDLALIYFIKEQNYEKPYSLNYNINLTSEAIKKLFYK
jgi:hypothetical protein